MSLIESVIDKPMRALVYGCCIVSAAMLGAALIAQYVFDLFPCELCIFQRIPYGIIAVGGWLAIMVFKTETALARVAALCGVLFLVDAGIAGYHTGVEYGVFKGPSACSNNGKPGTTLEEMRAAIMNAPLVSCDQPMAYFLGLSMAAWNTLAATTYAMTVFAVLDRMRRMRKASRTINVTSSGGTQY